MDSSERKLLIKQRGITKASLTRIKTFVNSFDQSSDLNAVRVRLERLPQIWEEYNDIQRKLELYDDEDHSDDREVFEETYYETQSRCLSLTETARSPTPTQSQASSVKSQESSSAAVGNMTRLPTIKIPTFSGNVAEFMHFHDTFRSLIVNNIALDNIQRFHYLLSSLTSEARTLIESLPVTSTNFNVAWDLVCKRYKNPRLIAITHIKNLLTLPHVVKESVHDMRFLLNQLVSNTNAIESLNLETPMQEMLISQLVLERLDHTSRNEWEAQSDTHTFSNLSELISFIEKRCQQLEIVESIQTKQTRSSTSQSRQGSTRQVYVATNTACVACDKEHPLYKCSKFLNLNLQQRTDIVRQNRLCFNCLHPGHNLSQCNSSRCHKCRMRHHTLLHREFSRDRQENYHQPHHNSPNLEGKGDKNNTSETVSSEDLSTYCSFKVKPETQILLSTALVKIPDSNGKLHTCRALLDSGSQSNFIVESLVQRLGLRKSRNHVSIQGINSVRSETKYMANVEVLSSTTDYKFNLTCSVLPRITGNLPALYIESQDWGLPDDIQLADVNFYQPGPVELLIGAGAFFHLLRPNRRTRPGNYPVLQETELGWILSGPTPGSNSTQNIQTFLVRNDDDLEIQLKRFWELEEVHSIPMSLEERQCEIHYKENTMRSISGKYIVRLPTKQSAHALGQSFDNALRRIQQLEKRLERQPALRQLYNNFMAEYEALGHMKKLEEENLTASQPIYYLPHHPVLKDSSTTKLRVVFDASAKTSNNTSLNDILMVGPTIQQDLFSIIMRFRTHNIVFTADIEKMYRQIEVHPSDLNLQRILWRTSSQDTLQHYQLTTITYGTASAPFLATRTLRELALNERGSYPKAAEVLTRDFYIDDVMSGAQTVNQALLLQKDLIELLHKGGFHLRKWCSNRPALLAAVPPDDREARLPFQIDDTNIIKTLGLSWEPSADKFKFPIQEHQKIPQSTKRGILSIIASIFDPLGLLGPIVVRYKILMQRLWQLKLRWDETLPIDIQQQWSNLQERFHHITEIDIKRLATCEGIVVNAQLHGFCDASEAAYGACLFLRCSDDKGRVTVNLLCSKSRVAPLKQVSIPRLELCGALLLAKLTKKTYEALNIEINSVHLWTDSTVVLSWLSSAPTRWKTFIANRVSEIQDITHTYQWRHVRSAENPADLISRGTSPDELKHMRLWWNGPAWLSELIPAWPSLIPETYSSTDILEERKAVVTLLNTRRQSFIVLENYSTLSRLQGTVAYCLRFIYNVKHCRSERHSGTLSPTELQDALHCIIRMVQQNEFTNEYHKLETSQQVDNKSKLRNLNPFICGHRLIRVGGRLQNSLLSFQQRHPIILPPNNHLIQLIIEHEHKRLLHGNSQLLLASLRQKFWILNAKGTIRKIIHRCITCCKLKADTSQQLMGQLPQSRVKPARPFLNCGVDYAGPIYIKQGSRRSKTKVKGYVSIFICLTTKAIHLELVSDLTTEAFLAALRRFVARRGHCCEIWSDNGTNFVGAARELQDILNSNHHQEVIFSECSQKGIKWHFNPPSAPHFGGLWEAAVKSMKYHLRRIMGNSCLTFEELSTLLIQIEACLNSRPLLSVSNDPSDLSILTPGHFLIGEPLTTIPEPDLTNDKLSLHSRWRLLQQQLQHFWRRWSSDYLNQLQQRGKWTSHHPNIQTGAVVILKENNIPPLQWKTGIIDAVHPGTDGMVRVVSVRTSSGIIKRPVTKLCFLPIETK